MVIYLSWDLFIIVFFAVVIAYSFIIGKNQTLKVIIGSYIAILTADGLGNLVQIYLLNKSTSLSFIPSGLEDEALTFLKIGVFITGIVLLAVRGGFRVEVADEDTVIMRLVATFCFGFLNAGLIVSTILVYASGFSFVSGSFDITLSPIFDVYKQSQMVQIMINNYNFWFSVPAIAFVFSSIIGSGKDD